MSSGPVSDLYIIFTRKRIALQQQLSVRGLYEHFVGQFHILYEYLVPYSRKPDIKNKKAGDSFEIK